MIGSMASDSRSLREDALACIHAAIAAVEPERLVREWLEAHGDVVGDSRTVQLAAFGKAAAGMARGAVAVLGGRLRDGIVILPADDPAAERRTDPGLPDRLRVFRGGHPVPTEEGVAGARAILELAQELDEDDLLLTLVSGGGSALLTLPADGVPLDAIRATTDALLRAGADIRQLNTVRKHLDRLKGGRLARAAHPARTLALLLSDVVGDPPDTIASGPVSPDPTTYGDALQRARRSRPRRHGPGRRPRAPGAGPGRGDRGVAEAGRRRLRHVEAHVVGDNSLAADAARSEAERRGYRTLLLSTRITGEAREVGRVLAGIGAEILASGTPIAAPACVIAGGETTVTVTGSGRGGRNQEVALGAALALDELIGADDDPETPAGDRILVAAAGTDGIDGPTDAAGAIATADTLRRARARGLDPRRALADNDAYPFFDGLGDLILTGPTGTNVMDVALLLVRRQES